MGVYQAIESLIDEAVQDGTLKLKVIKGGAMCTKDSSMAGIHTHPSWVCIPG